jgi:hypothetical protein
VEDEGVLPCAVAEPLVVPCVPCALVPCVPCAPCALADPLIEPCELLSDGTEAAAPEFGWLVVPAEAVDAVPCVPFAPAAVPCVPEMEPDCVVPVSFAAVRVLLLLLLHAANAAASAMPSRTFIV